MRIEIGPMFWCRLGVRTVVSFFVAVALLAVAFQPAAAKSAHLAALEVRVKQLEEALSAQREVIREMRELLKNAATAAVPADKVAKIAKSGNPHVALTISGQVNRAILYADDGEGRNVFHVDNDNSSTRVRAVGTARLNDDFGVGARGEVQFESNSSASVNQLSDEDVGPNNFTERKLELWLASKRFGKLTLGQGDTASNGTSEVDKSGTAVIGYSAIDAMAGGLLFARKDFAPGTGITAISRASPRIGPVFTNMDGLGRDDRIRYDTPKIEGAQLSASHTSGDDSDLALRYAGKFGSVEVATAFGFAHRADNRNQYAGSISSLHKSGLNVTFAAGAQVRQNKAPGDKPKFWYAKLGYQFNLFSFGKTALAIDYAENSDIRVGGDFGRAYGFFAVQRISKLATEIYLGIRNHSYDQNGANFEDILAAMFGARVKF